MPTVQINDVSIFYTTIFQGKETLLNPHIPTMLVHHGGFGTVDHQLELKPWSPLSENIQLVFFDQRGCGQSSDGDPSLWTVEQFGKDMFHLINALHLSMPIVAGISSGGYAVLSYAVQFPSHTSGLILLNTEPVVSPEDKCAAYMAQAKRSDKLDFEIFKSLTEAEIAEYAKKAGRSALEYDYHPTQENFDTFASYGYSTISKTSFEFVPPFRVNMKMKQKLANGYQQFDFTKQLPQIQCPVLWFAGEWDPLHPMIGAKKATEKINHTELHILKAGAPIYQDAPEEFYKITRMFLAKILKQG